MGILVAEGGRAIVKDCHFSNILRQAIEVRAAGELEVQDSTFRRTLLSACAVGLLVLGTDRDACLVMRCKLLPRALSQTS